MNHRAEFLASVEQAEHHVGNARRRWDPASMERCSECIQELQDAVAAMESAQRAAAHATSMPELKQRLERLGRDLQTLSRSVDASLAFCRGLALRTGHQEAAHASVEG